MDPNLNWAYITRCPSPSWEEIWTHYGIIWQTSVCVWWGNRPDSAQWTTQVGLKYCISNYGSTGWPFFETKCFSGCSENQSQTLITGHRLMKYSIPVFWHKYWWKFVKVPIKLRKFVLFLKKKSGLWKIILGIQARCLFSGPACKIPGTWLPYQYNIMYLDGANINKVPFPFLRKDLDIQSTLFITSVLVPSDLWQNESAVVMISCHFDHKMSKRRTNIPRSCPGLPCPHPLLP